MSTKARADPVLLLHGNPTWSFLHRKFIPLRSDDRSAATMRWLKQSLRSLKIFALVPGFDPVDPDAIDEDIWRFREWLIARLKVKHLRLKLLR
jgi:hypothetical protein